MHAYRYGRRDYCAECLTEQLLGEARLAPAALDMDIEESLRQMREAEALTKSELRDANVYPQRLDFSDVGDCARCDSSF